MTITRPVGATFAASTFLGMLGRDDRSAVLAQCRVQTFGIGEPIFREGDRDARVAVLLAGHVKLEAHAASGRKALLGLRSAGDLLGEMRAFDGQGRAARISPLVDVRAGILPADRFRALVSAYPSIALAALRMLTGRLRESDRHRLDLGTSDAIARVSACLLDLVTQYGATAGGDVELVCPLTQEELGTWAGVSRPATARALRRLREDGVVEQHGRRLRKIDTVELARRAEA